jgi:hypothetical protein
MPQLGPATQKEVKIKVRGGKMGGEMKIGTEMAIG